MTDTEILNALQAALDEHFDAGNLGFDVFFGPVNFTVRPSLRHDARSGVIHTGQCDLRETLISAVQPHLTRLVTRELTKR